jgi:biotin carboxyl carrier protein
MKWHVTVNERVVEVDLTALPDLQEVEPGVYSALVEGRSYQIRIAHVRGGHEVDIAGQRLLVDATDPHRAPPRRRHGQEDRTNITASMPGKVIRVLVNASDAVTAGQGVVVLEAMKMQNEVKAPHAGRVAAVRAIAGATVAAGDVLMTIDHE